MSPAPGAPLGRRRGCARGTTRSGRMSSPIHIPRCGAWWYPHRADTHSDPARGRCTAGWRRGTRHAGCHRRSQSTAGDGHRRVAGHAAGRPGDVQNLVGRRRGDEVLEVDHQGALAGVRALEGGHRPVAAARRVMTCSAHS